MYRRNREKIVTIISKFLVSILRFPIYSGIFQVSATDFSVVLVVLLLTKINKYEHTEEILNHCYWEYLRNSNSLVDLLDTDVLHRRGSDSNL